MRLRMRFGMTVLLISALMTSAWMVTGCQSDTDNDAGQTFTVISTIFPPYDFARVITGEKAEVIMLLPPATEVHAFEPTPGDIRAIHACDLFIYAGGASDAWVETALTGADKVRTLTLMDCVEPVSEEDELNEHIELTDHVDHVDHADHTENSVHIDHTDHANHADHTDHAEYNEYDEHVWTSPRNAILIVEKITNALCEADAANAAYYRKNAAAYIAQLQDLDKAFTAATTDTARKTLVFGDRFPFQYLTDAYGLTYAAAFPGCSAETEASAATVASLIDKVRSEHIPIVFYTEMANERLAAVIAEETGAQTRVFYACHTVTKEDYTNNVGYIDLMMRNVDALKEALG